MRTPRGKRRSRHPAGALAAHRRRQQPAQRMGLTGQVNVMPREQPVRFVDLPSGRRGDHRLPPSMRGVVKRAGLSHRIPHDFRRTAVRNLERAGVPRSAAMKMVGHRTEAIYRRYAIADEGVLRDAAEKLATRHHAERNGAATVVALPVTAH
jgi:hypothetical protein